MSDVGIQTAAVELVGSATLVGQDKIIARLADAASDGGLIR